MKCAPRSSVLKGRTIAHRYTCGARAGVTGSASEGKRQDRGTGGSPSRYSERKSGSSIAKRSQVDAVGTSSRWNGTCPQRRVHRKTHSTPSGRVLDRVCRKVPARFCRDPTIEHRPIQDRTKQDRGNVSGNDDARRPPAPIAPIAGHRPTRSAPRANRHRGKQAAHSATAKLLGRPDTS